MPRITIGKSGGIEMEQLHKPWMVLKKAMEGQIELPVKVRVHDNGEKSPECVLQREDDGFVHLKTAEGKRTYCIFSPTEEWEIVIEPRFKKGDWVRVSFTNTDIVGFGTFNRIEGEYAIFESWGSTKAPNQGTAELPRHMIEVSLATPEEIAAEKQRRWWKKLDRDADEYRAGDIVMHSEGLSVWVMRGEEKGELLLHECTDGGCVVKRAYADELRLVCPVEERRDK